MTTSRPAPRVRFGPFEVDLQNGRAFKHGRRINVQPQPFKILTLLLEHPGELVTREQLRQSLWPDGLYVDFEHGLNRSINKLRYILLDRVDSPRFIETVPGRGYRLIVPVELLDAPNTSTRDAESPQRSSAAEPREAPDQPAASNFPEHASMPRPARPLDTASPAAAYTPLARSPSTPDTAAKASKSGFFARIPTWARIAVAVILLAAAGAPLLRLQSHARPISRHPRVVSVEARRFVYVADYSANSILAYAVDPSSGALQPTPVNAFNTRQHPYAVLVSTPYLYVANRGLGDEVCGDGCNVSAFIIDPLSGSLAQLDSSPVPAGRGPADLAIDPSLHHLYVVSVASNTLQVYARLPGGGLQQSGSPVPLGRRPFSVAITLSGRFLYVTNQDDANISAFSLGPDGQPAPVPGSPFATGLRPRAIAIDPSGRRLYVVNYGVNPLPNRHDACTGEFYGVKGTGCTISGYAIDQQTGALAPLPGSPFASDGVNPLSAAIDSSGKFLFVANVTSNDVSVYTIDPGTGALRHIDKSPFPAGQGPDAIALDWSDSYLYVANAFSHDITQFAIEDDGSLTPVTRPVPAGAGPLAIAAQHGTGK